MKNIKILKFIAIKIILLLTVVLQYKYVYTINKKQNKYSTNRFKYAPKNNKFKSKKLNTNVNNSYIKDIYLSNKPKPIANTNQNNDKKALSSEMKNMLSQIKINRKLIKKLGSYNNPNIKKQLNENDKQINGLSNILDNMANRRPKRRGAKLKNKTQKENLKLISNLKKLISNQTKFIKENIKDISDKLEKDSNDFLEKKNELLNLRSNKNINKGYKKNNKKIENLKRLVNDFKKKLVSKLEDIKEIKNLLKNRNSNNIAEDDIDKRIKAYLELKNIKDNSRQTKNNKKNIRKLKKLLKKYKYINNDNNDNFKKEVENQIQYLEEKQLENQEDIDINRENIDRNNEDIQKNQEDIDRNNEDIQKNQEDIDRNNEDIQKNQEDIDRNNEDIQKNQEDIDINKENIYYNNEDIQNITDVLADNNHQTYLNEKDIKQIIDNISYIDTKFKNLSNKVDNQRSYVDNQRPYNNQNTHKPRSNTNYNNDICKSIESLSAGITIGFPIIHFKSVFDNDESWKPKVAIPSEYYSENFKSYHHKYIGFKLPYLSIDLDISFKLNSSNWIHHLIFTELGYFAVAVKLKPEGYNNLIEAYIRQINTRIGYTIEFLNKDKCKENNGIMKYLGINLYPYILIGLFNTGINFENFEPRANENFKSIQEGYNLFIGGGLGMNIIIPIFKMFKISIVNKFDFFYTNLINNQKKFKDLLSLVYYVGIKFRLN